MLLKQVCYRIALTGKVGNMDAATMIDASNAIRRTDGIFTLRAYAKGNITVAGPKSTLRSGKRQ